MFYPDISNSTSEFMETYTLNLSLAARYASHGRGKPLTKIGFANASIPSPFPTKNEPPMREVR